MIKLRDNKTRFTKAGIKTIFKRLSDILILMNLLKIIFEIVQYLSSIFRVF